MDEINSQFGQLSTNAPEWKPGGGSNNRSAQVTSDLKATSVKEFVPGAGWSAQPSAASEKVPLPQTEKSTQPAGPTPPPLPSFRAIHSMSLGDDMWRHYRNISLQSTRQMPPRDDLHKAIPAPYCNAFCLDHDSTAGSSLSSSYGYPSSTFQVTSRDDGNLYCLHRFDNVRSVSPKIAASVSERWNVPQVQEHPGIVPFYQCFMTQRAVFFVHHFIPGAQSLRDRLTGPLSESVLWSVICQLVSAISILHEADLAARTLHLHQVLCTTDSKASSLRVRLGCLGIVDALEFQARKHVKELQIQDMRDLGGLLLSLATGTVVTAHSDSTTFRSCEQFMARNFSRDFQNLALSLLNPRLTPSIVDVRRLISSRLWVEQDATYRSIDTMERALSAEYDSGRILRMLLKLGFCNERPECGPNRRWSQSGDCYVLSLFANFVFHQADGSGAPVMDLGHVLACLNKLDAAEEEKICLASRDGKTLMVVTYAEVAQCLEGAFQELCSGAVPPPALQYD